MDSYIMKIYQQYFLADVMFCVCVYVHALHKFTCTGWNACYTGETTRHTILYVFTSTLCQTKLCIFTSTCSHQGLVMTRGLQNLSLF